MIFPCLFVLITEKTWHHLICKDFAVFLFLEDVVHQTVCLDRSGTPGRVLHLGLTDGETWILFWEGGMLVQRPKEATLVCRLLLSLSLLLLLLLMLLLLLLLLWLLSLWLWLWLLLLLLLLSLMILAFFFKIHVTNILRPMNFSSNL